MSAIIDHYSQTSHRLLKSFFASLSVMFIVFFGAIGIIIGLVLQNSVIALVFFVIGGLLYYWLQGAAQSFSNEARIRRLQEKLKKSLDQAERAGEKERENLYRRTIQPGIEELTSVINSELHSRRDT